MEVGKRVWACSHSSAYFHHANNYCCYYTTYSQPFIMPLHWQCKKNMLYWRGDKCVSKKLMPTKSGILESASGTNFLIWTKVFIDLDMFLWVARWQIYGFSVKCNSSVRFRWNFNFYDFPLKWEGIIFSCSSSNFFISVKIFTYLDELPWVHYEYVDVRPSVAR